MQIGKDRLNRTEHTDHSVNILIQVGISGTYYYDSIKSSC